MTPCPVRGAERDVMLTPELEKLARVVDPETGMSPWEAAPSAERTLRLRYLIAEKELSVAQANYELQKYGEWQCDHRGYNEKLNEEIERLMPKEANHG